MTGAARQGTPFVGARLSLMMFLQYAVWGVWLPYLANYLTSPLESGGLGFTGRQVGWLLGLAGSIGAVTAPFLAGQIADRFINAEKYLGLLLIVGGCVKFATYYVHDYPTFLALSVLYSVAYMPTLALTNSIAFAHLSDPERRFAPIRTWGTIGWIVASNAFPLLWLQSNLHLTALPPFVAGAEKANATALFADCLRVAGAVSVLYGAWAMFFLPKTPPTRSVENPLAFAKAFGLLRRPGFLVVTLAALPISMIHQVFFIRTGPFLESIGFSKAHIGPVMSIGQFSEILVLALLGFLLVRLGYRWTLALGCLAYAARFAIFAVATPETRPMVGAAMALHGLCYGCFFAGAYIYVDRVAPTDIRHSAQTVFGIIILGVGPVLAAVYNDGLEQLARGFDASGPFRWAPLWWAQAAVGLSAAALVALAFRPGAIGGRPLAAAGLDSSGEPQ